MTKDKEESYYEANKRKKRFQDKLDEYLQTYEVDSLNMANDMASLRQLVNLDIINEDIAEKIHTTDDPKQKRQLITALKDSTNAFVSLQDQLGLARKKRESESDENPRTHIQKIQEQVGKIMDKRLTKVKCDCDLVVAKYLRYFPMDGPDPGSIAYEQLKEPPRELKFTVRFECPRCLKVVEVGNEREN